MHNPDTSCPHSRPGCPGPAGYDVDDFDSEICGECEVAAICAEPPIAPVFNEHGLLVCDHHAGCRRPAVTGGRCDWHQDLNEG